MPNLYLSDAMLLHAFELADTVCCAGSQAPEDYELALKLAQVLSRNGWTSPPIEQWLKGVGWRNAKHLGG